MNLEIQILYKSDLLRERISLVYVHHRISNRIPIVGDKYLEVHAPEAYTSKYLEVTPYSTYLSLLPTSSNLNT